MNYRRIIIPGCTYFFTINLADRKRKLLIRHITQLRMAFKKVKIQHPFKTEAIVILPDHLHVIMTLPPGDANYSLRISLIKGYFSRQITGNEERSVSKQIKRERNIWQRRFWEHFIRDEKDFEKHVDYIHYNPVKHRYVKNPVQWPYSSLHLYLQQSVLPSNWITKAQPLTDDYGE